MAEAAARSTKSAAPWRGCSAISPEAVARPRSKVEYKKSEEAPSASTTQSNRRASARFQTRGSGRDGALPVDRYFIPEGKRGDFARLHYTCRGSGLSGLASGQLGHRSARAPGCDRLRER